MDSQWVEVFHVADGDTVVEAVAHHLVFHFFPSLERFLHEYLGRERKGLLGEGHEFLLIVAETAAEASEGIGCAHYHREAEAVGSLYGLLHGIHSLALDCLYADFIELFDEEFAVFGVHDSLYGGAEHFQIVLFKHPAFV